MKKHLPGQADRIAESPTAITHGDNLILTALRMVCLCLRGWCCCSLKGFAALLLALVMVFSCAPEYAWADMQEEETEQSEDSEDSPDGEEEGEDKDGTSEEDGEKKDKKDGEEDEDDKANTNAEPDEPLPYEGAVKITADFLREEMHLNTAAICGILANIQNESNFDPLATGDGGTSRGICQWSKKRWDRFLVFCENNRYESDTLTAQLHFMKIELENFYPETLRIIVGARNDEDSADNIARYFCADYETPKGVSREIVERRKLAREGYWPMLSELDPKVIPMEQAEAEIITADFMRNEMHLSIAATAGIMANIKQESGFNPLLVGDNNQAFGICQWTGRRQKDLKKFCQRNDYDENSLDAQLEFMKFEMERDYSETLLLIRCCNNDLEGAKEAARLFCKNYEVPTRLENSIKDRKRVVREEIWPLMQTMYSEEMQEETREEPEIPKEAEIPEEPAASGEEERTPEESTPPEDVTDSDSVEYVVTVQPLSNVCERELTDERPIAASVPPQTAHPLSLSPTE